MRKAASILNVLLLTVTLSFADDKDVAQYYFDRGYVENAIKSIERALNSPLNKKPDTWMLKYHIYKKAETTSPYNSFPDICLKHQFEAVVGILELNEPWLLINEFGNNYKNELNRFYNQFVDFGTTQNENENYAGALKQFENALDVYDQIYKYGLDPSSFDTVLVFNAGYCALRAEKYPETEKYFKKLADVNVKNEQYSDVYSWLIEYYMLEKKDFELANSILEKGLRFYPNHNNLNELKAYLTQLRRGQ